MSWRERLRPASFRGVPFHVADATREVGRRTEVHELPFADEPVIEDLGRQARRFEVEAFVLGADYDRIRDALIEALEAYGPGQLVHPTYGAKLVTPLPGGRVSESSRDGGMAVFSLTFVEAGRPPRTGQADTGSAVVAAASTADAAAAEAAAAAVQVDGKPAFVGDRATHALARARAEIQTAAAGLRGAAEGVRGFASRIDLLRDRAFGLVRAPLDLALSVRGALSALTRLAQSPREAFRSLLRLTRVAAGGSPFPAFTPARRAAEAAERGVIALVARAAAIEAARLLPDLPFASYEDAVEARDALSEALDRLATAAADAGEDAVFDTLSALQAAAVRDVTVRGGSLARLRRHAEGATLPALVIAHKLYGDGRAGTVTARAQEIVARNRIRHPGRVPGGRALEVPTDG